MGNEKEAGAANECKSQKNWGKKICVIVHDRDEASLRSTKLDFSSEGEGKPRIELKVG